MILKLHSHFLIDWTYIGPLSQAPIRRPQKCVFCPPQVLYSTSGMVSLYLSTYIGTGVDPYRYYVGDWSYIGPRLLGT